MVIRWPPMTAAEWEAKYCTPPTARRLPKARLLQIAEASRRQVGFDVINDPRAAMAFGLPTRLLATRTETPLTEPRSILHAIRAPLLCLTAIVDDTVGFRRQAIFRPVHHRDALWEHEHGIGTRIADASKRVNADVTFWQRKASTRCAHQVGPWSEREVRILRRDYGKPGRSVRTIAAKLGRSSQSVGLKAALLGFSWSRVFRASAKGTSKLRNVRHPGDQSGPARRRGWPIASAAYLHDALKTELVAVIE